MSAIRSAYEAAREILRSPVMRTVVYPKEIELSIRNRLVRESATSSTSSDLQLHEYYDMCFVFEGVPSDYESAEGPGALLKQKWGAWRSTRIYRPEIQLYISLFCANRSYSQLMRGASIDVGGTTLQRRYSQFDNNFAQMIKGKNVEIKDTSERIDVPLAYVQTSSESGTYVSAGIGTVPPCYDLQRFQEDFEADSITLLRLHEICRSLFFDLLRRIGVEIHTYSYKDRTCYLLRLSEPALETFAEANNYMLHAKTSVYGSMGDKLIFRKTKRNLFQTYDIKDEESPQGLSIFRRIDRIRLLEMTIQHYFNLSVISKPLGNNRIEQLDNLGNMQTHRTKMVNKIDQQKVNIIPAVMTTSFCLHDPCTLKKLSTTWHLFGHSTFSVLRTYCGEEIAKFHIWQSTVINSFAVVGVVGVVLYILSKMLRGSWTIVFPFTYALMLAAWPTIFNQRWKTVLKACRASWGEWSFHSLENQNFKFEFFEADPIRRNVLVKSANRFRTNLRRRFSNTIFTFTIIVVLSVNILLCYLGSIERLQTLQHGTLITAIVKAVVLQILDMCWEFVLSRLIALENHRYQSDQIRSITLKSFTFKLINNFSPLFLDTIMAGYTVLAATTPTVSFWEKMARYLNIPWVCEVKKTADTTYPALQLQLVVNCVISSLVCVTMQLVKPAVHVVLQGVGTDSVDRQVKMKIYSCVELYNEYLEICLHIAYVLFFSLITPYLPFILIIRLLLGMSANKVALLKLYRRVYPANLDDYGNELFEILALLGDLAPGINAALLIFLIPNWPGGYRLLSFLLFEQVFILGRLALSFMSLQKHSQVLLPADMYTAMVDHLHDV